MSLRTRSFRDRMRSIGIRKDRKLLVRRNQRIDQRLGALEVNVVIAGPVNHQKIALQL